MKFELKRESRKTIRKLAGILDACDGAGFEALIDEISAADAVFVAGWGRTKLIADALAARLAQLGVTVHSVGDVTAPALGPGDLLFVASGSGETDTVATWASKARAAGGRVAVLTARPGSRVGRCGHVTVRIPIYDAEAEKAGRRRPRAAAQKPGMVQEITRRTLFEEALLLYVDMLAMALANRLGISMQEMMGRHANLQ